MSRLIVFMEGENDKGIRAIASEHMLPGQLILCEVPALYVDEIYLQQFKSQFGDAIMAQFYAVYCKFQSLSVSEQHRYLSLMNATLSLADTIFLENIRIIMLARSASEIDPPFTSKKYETLQRVYSIYKHNACRTGEGNSIAVYGSVTSVPHSCLPNTCRNFVGNMCELRAILPIKRGDELTLEFNPQYRNKPTHFRRYRYMLTRHFTCHCPRCDAVGDDTRQFNCLNRKCPGVHLVCQPLNRDPFVYPGCATEITDMVYTGVQYVEPHLLPCSVCRTTPPLHYQTEMFAVESRMPAITALKHEEFRHLKQQGRADFAKFKAFLASIEELRLPMTHHLSEDLVTLALQVTLDLADNYAAFTPAQRSESLHMRSNAVKTYLLHYKPVQSQYPSPLAARIYHFAGQVVEYGDQEAALRLFQRAVRVNRICLGRNNSQQAVFEQDLLALMNRLLCKRRNSLLPSLPNVSPHGECLFCCESPDKAAITLVQCNLCHLAEYCSRECQKAHFKLHLRDCSGSHA